LHKSFNSKDLFQNESLVCYDQPFEIIQYHLIQNLSKLSELSIFLQGNYTYISLFLLKVEGF
jgi:hypothetical protein